MCKNLYILLLTVILLSNEVFSKNEKNKENVRNFHKNYNKKNGKVINERGKRSLHENEKAFLSHVGQEYKNGNIDGVAKYTSEELLSNPEQKYSEVEPPFWGTRGRRDSSSESTEDDSDENKEVKCKSCDKYFHDFHKNVIKEELDPFWFERGVKDKSNEFNPFWGNRGRRDEIEPFWGNRGRRDEVEPFWGNRGRREEKEPFWGNRGRRGEMEPFWGNRGRRDEAEPFWGNRGRRDEAEPFWGNRGRRDETEPFWGNRGKRQENEPFWGTRGRRDSKNSLRDLYWDTHEKKKLVLKENIFDAMDNIKYGVENLARVRRGEGNLFWNNRGRNSKLGNLFKQDARNRNLFLSNRLIPSKLIVKPAEQNTLLDERMYAEQPHYILIERTSRSSAEEDPFFISRGKKYRNSKSSDGFRDRRGVFEELVKSVRTDPYYIARGKKDSDYIKIGNSTIKGEFVKAKELICSAINLIGNKSDDHKLKRDVDESERERRTILKNLAAQLQMDPYFVSRGKKNGESDTNEERLEEFINHISDMCN